MNPKPFSQVIISIAVAALLIVPLSFVILQTNNYQTKKAAAYNPYINTEYYYGTNGTGQYYNSTFDQPIQDQSNFINRYDSYNSYYDTNGNVVAVSDFNQPTVFDTNGKYSYSKEYQADQNCNYYWSDNCSNFPLTPEPNYSVFNDYQEPYIFNVPTPNTYNYYNPNQENFQDPLKPYYPDQDFNLDPGYYNS